MPAASAPNLAKWRSDKPYQSSGHLFILKPEVVFQARINMASVTYPLTSLTFDTVTTGAYTDIEPGQTLFLGSSAGAYDLGRTRVRAIASSSAIPIGRTPKGKQRGELLVSDNMYITVINLYEVWAKIPFISSSGVSLKDQISFAANIAQPPIANGGPAVGKFVDRETDILSVDFTAALSQIVDPSASSLTYLWDFRQGDTSTSVSPTDIEFEPGFYYVRLTVNDGTRDHTTHIPVAALARSGEFAPIPVEISPRTARPEGQSISFTLKAQDVDLSEYPPGTLVIYFEEERYGLNTPESLAGTAGREQVKFVGWLDTEPTRIAGSSTGLKREVTLNALDVAGQLAKHPGFGQRIVNKTTPTNWQQMKSANIDRYLHHLLHWHSTALEVAPFTWSGQGANYPFHDLGSDGANLYEQVDSRARAIAYRLTCSKNGELMVKGDVQRLPFADRTNTSILTLATTDWSLASYTMKPPSHHWVKGNAVTPNAATQNAVFSIAPGATPGQGESEMEVGQQLATQTVLNSRTRNDYDRVNAPEAEFAIDLTHGGDIGIDPALMEWVEFDISAEVAAQRGLIIPPDSRFHVLEATIRHDDRTQTNKWSLKLEREVNTAALTAETFTPATSSQTTQPFPPLPPTPYPNIPEPTPIPGYPIPGLPPSGPMQPPLPDASGNLVLLATPTYVGVARRFKETTNPDYVNITPPLEAGEIIQVAKWSGFGTDVYVLVNDGSNSRVYYCENGVATNIEWQAGAQIEGIYTQIRTTSTQGGLYILGTGATTTILWDLTIDDYGGVIPPPGSTATEGFGSFGANGLESSTTPNAGDDYFAAANWVGLTDVVTITLHFDDQIFDLGLGLTGNGFTLGAPTYEDFDETGYVKQWSGLPPENSDFSVFPFYSAKDGASYYLDWIEWEISGGGGLQTCYSSDYGATFDSPQTVDEDFVGVYAGIDTVRVGTKILAGATDQVVIATSGSAYAAYGSALPAAGVAGCIVIPYYQLTSNSVKNNGSTPEYLASLVEVDGDDESLYRVTAGGNTFFGITPTQGGDQGVAVSPNCVFMPWRSGQVIVSILDYAGTRRLKVSTNTGAAWTDRGALETDADYIRMRKSDTTLQELYFINNGAAIYSADFGVTLEERAYPADDALVSIEPYG